MSPLRKMGARIDYWSLFPHCFYSVVASVTHCMGKAIVFPDVLIIDSFKFFQKITINNSLSLFVNKSESANSTTVVNIFPITVTHLKRVHSSVIKFYIRNSAVLARKESRAARVLEAAHAMLDIPGWPVRRRITRAWTSFSHSNRYAKYRAKILILSKKSNRNIYLHLWVYKNSQILNTIMLIRYLRKAQRISGEFRADMAKSLRYILCCEQNFPPRVSPCRTTQTNMASKWHVCMIRVRRHETTPSFTALWLGTK